MLSFANASVLPMAVERFFTFVAAVIAATVTAVIVAARKPAGGSTAMRIANTSKLLMEKLPTAIVSRTTVNARHKTPGMRLMLMPYAMAVSGNRPA